jgi:hypothetical protein
MNRSIRDILPPTRRMEYQQPQQPMYAPPPTPPSMQGRMRRRGKFPLKILIACVVVVLIVFSSLFIFGKSTLTLYRSVQDTTISGEFTATRKEGTLPFDVITIEKKASKSVPAEGTEKVELFSEGTISIKNTSKETQPLVKNTRFESSEGYIYRIRESITIAAGTVTKPSETKIKVYSDIPGEQYNLKKGVFTIPGLKDSPITKQLTIEAVEEFTGGFAGERPTVSEETKQSIVAQLQQALRDSFLTDLRKSVPEEYVFINGGASTTFQTLPNASAGAGTASIEVSAVTHAVVFANEVLAGAVAAKTVGSYQGERITIANPDSLTLVGGAIAPSINTFSFVLSGKPQLSWVVDSAKIASSLAGKSITAGKVHLNQLPEVDRFEFSPRPFFLSSFPADSSDIEVIVSE